MILALMAVVLAYQISRCAMAYRDHDALWAVMWAVSAAVSIVGIGIAVR